MGNPVHWNIRYILDIIDTLDILDILDTVDIADILDILDILDMYMRGHCNAVPVTEMNCVL